MSFPPLVVVSMFSLRFLKPMTPLLKSGHGGNQMGKGSPQAVKPPDDESITRPDIVQGFV
jgi:hypothetical protein